MPKNDDFDDVFSMPKNHPEKLHFQKEVLVDHSEDIFAQISPKIIKFSHSQLLILAAQRMMTFGFEFGEDKQIMGAAQKSKIMSIPTNQTVH